MEKEEPIVAGGDQKALFGFIALVLYDLHELDVGTFLYSKQDGAATAMTFTDIHLPSITLTMIGGT